MALQGRVTDIINVMGEKISPAPVEDRLAELFGVAGVCLFANPNDSGEEEIHLVIESPTPIDSEQVNAAIKQLLCGFDQAHVYCMVTLPSNGMGKVLRQEVRASAIAANRNLPVSNNVKPY
jgi:acyl-CoA synthetase (AMP-forming)/AMP-acid ligase II